VCVCGVGGWGGGGWVRGEAVLKAPSSTYELLRTSVPLPCTCTDMTDHLLLLCGSGAAKYRPRVSTLGIPGSQVVPAVASRTIY
jgi:hypothetical protein